MDAPQPYRLTTPDGALDALRDRLRATRRPGPLLDDAGWGLGTDPAYLRELVAYWADGFDWPARERRSTSLRTSGDRRRGGPPLRARAGRDRVRVPAAAQPRLAGLVLALPEGRAAADRPGRARRRPG